MAQSAGRVPPMPSAGYGKAFLVGGSAVLAGLSGVWMMMLRNKKRQELTGTNPNFEQVIARVSKPVDPDNLPVRNDRYSEIPPARLRTEHNSGHSTHKNFRQSPQYLEYGAAGRRMVPPPQRAATDGTGRAYTKSPAFVDNYNKTTRPPKAIPAASS
ncbi:hypothetical protein CPC08DRAFT_44625 [Agrocybe pediades]|nr:hypothetical protein CPC08DRAFT_44625 [Agrocybe pediades]